MDIRLIPISLLLFLGLGAGAQTDGGLTLNGVQLKKNEKGRNELSWNAAASENTDCFLIQRSADGRQFRTVGKRTAIKALEDTDYSFVDMSYKGNAFYRIIEVTTEGKALYSSPVKREEPSKRNRAKK